MAAYLPRPVWLRLLENIGISEAEYAARYDLVLHLVTTAHGLEAVYQQQADNNAARTENAAQARALDDEVYHCWTAVHPAVVRLGNEVSGFDEKMQAAVDAVMARLQS